MAEEKKDWMVGSPDFKDRMFTRSEIQGLLREGKLMPNELVMRVGDVWKEARDYPELVEPEGPATSRPSRGRRPLRRPAVSIRRKGKSATGTFRTPTETRLRRVSSRPTSPEPKRSVQGPPRPKPPRDPEPADARGAPVAPRPVPAEPETGGPPASPPPKIVIRTRPEAPAGPAESPPEEETERDVPTVGREPGASTPPEPREEEAPAGEPTREERGDVQVHEPERAKPRKKRRSRIERPPPEPVVVELRIENFTWEDLRGRIKYIFHPFKLMFSLLLTLVALGCGLLVNLGAASASLLVASVLYFVGFGIFHGLVSFITRCEIGGEGWTELIVPYARRGMNLLLNVGLSVILLGSLSVGALIAYDMESLPGRMLVLTGTAFAFVLASLLYTMTAGVLNAILAVEVCGLKEALKKLAEVYRGRFSRILGHGALMTVLSYALFLVAFLPVMAYGVLWISDSGFKPPDPLIFILFGVGSSLAVAALGSMSVYSYLLLTRGGSGATKPAEVAGEEGLPRETSEGGKVEEPAGKEEAGGEEEPPPAGAVAGEGAASEGTEEDTALEGAGSESTTAAEGTASERGQGSPDETEIDLEGPEGDRSDAPDAGRRGGVDKNT